MAFMHEWFRATGDVPKFNRAVFGAGDNPTSVGQCEYAADRGGMALEQREIMVVLFEVADPQTEVCEPKDHEASVASRGHGTRSRRKDMPMMKGMSLNFGAGFHGPDLQLPA